MNRHEFLTKLEDALEGEVHPQVIQSNINYYDSYILGEVSSGRDEKEVLEELGDPRLIARTIFDSQEAAQGNYGGENYAYEEPEDRDRGFGSRFNYSSTTEYEEENGGENRLSDLWTRVRPTLIIAGIVILVLIVLSALFSLTLRILMSPVFWIAMAAWGLWRVFSR